MTSTTTTTMPRKNDVLTCDSHKDQQTRRKKLNFPQHDSFSFAIFFWDQPFVPSDKRSEITANLLQAFSQRFLARLQMTP
jgi:hypothetical protein